MAPAGRARRVVFTALLAALAVAITASLFFADKVRERERLLDAFIASALEGQDGLSTEETVVRLAHAVHTETRGMLRAEELDWFSRLLSTSPFNVTATTSLRYGGHSIAGQATAGPCGTMTRVLLNVLWKMKIPARKLQLFGERGEGHTMVEFYSGGRWLVVSPADSGFVWRRADGAIATAGEIQADAEIFSQIYERFPRYGYRFDRYGNIRWEKLPPRARAFFRAVLGKKRFENATTPRLYDQPRTLFLYTSVGVSILLAAAACVVRPGRARSRKV